MTREDKTAVIEDLSQKLSQYSNFYITDSSGLSVAQVNTLREMCYKKNVEFKVYKNTLIKIALQSLNADYSSFDESVLKGFSGIMFSEEDSSNAPAQVIKDFRKKNKDLNKPILKGASIDTDLFIGDDQLDMLSKLKSKAELIGEVIGLLQSPAKNVIGALQSGKHTLAGLVKTLSERE